MQSRTHAYLSRVFCCLLTAALGVAIAHLNQRFLTSQVSSRANNKAIENALPPARARLPVETSREQRPSDFFADDDELRYGDYTIKKRIRRARLDYPPEAHAPTEWVDVSYVTVKRGGKLLGKFDADVYFGLGNSANFGFFPFLDRRSQELFISQDVPRGGCQWIVRLSPGFRVIFDGREFGVGREGPDLSAVDLDKDGVYEVIAPITDFYALQDKMSISQIPLPDIVFKYDPIKGKYLPANPFFQECLLEEELKNERDVGTEDEFNHRSVVLNRMLTLIYAGKRKDAWEYFNGSYRLKDKEEMRRRVTSILSQQPVYKFVYRE